ncbi:hypothetical protein [Streptomyces sp. NPDC047097]|uniref:hypothetical protein n=1 Tax=Streptomyces sp. NPDC047097 TaxID=3155260 RepID=UPI0033F481BE
MTDRATALVGSAQRSAADEEQDMRFAFTVNSRYFLFDVVPSRKATTFGASRAA